MSEPITTVWLEMPLATVGDWDRIEKMRTWVDDRTREGHDIKVWSWNGCDAAMKWPNHVFMVEAHFADKGLAALFKLTWG